MHFGWWDRNSSALLTQVENLTDAAFLLPFPRPWGQQGYSHFGQIKQNILSACSSQSRLAFFHAAFDYWGISRASSSITHTYALNCLSLPFEMDWVKLISIIESSLLKCFLWRGQSQRHFQDVGWLKKKRFSKFLDPSRRTFKCTWCQESKIRQMTIPDNTT